MSSKTQFLVCECVAFSGLGLSASTAVSIDASEAKTDAIHALIFLPFLGLRSKLRKSTDVEEDIVMTPSENHQLARS
jgi:hypothetical protein